MNRREFLRLATIAGGVGAVGISGYTWLIEPHWVQVVERDLPVAGLAPALDGRRLVQLSDIHVGPRVDDEYLIESFQMAAALQPDIVVLTGDFLTHRQARGAAQFEQLRRVLAHLPHGRTGTVGILGNHDYGRNWAEPEVALLVARELERAGVHVLRNDAVDIGGLTIVGVDDLWARHANPMAALARRTNDAAIVLCHNPDTLDEAEWGDYRGWILAGHTHGGQCKPPFLPPPLLPVRNPLYSAGEIPLASGRRLYINRGLGHLLRVRFNVRPEITAFTLRPSAVT